MSHLLHPAIVLQPEKTAPVADHLSGSTSVLQQQVNLRPEPRANAVQPPNRRHYSLNGGHGELQSAELTGTCLGGPAMGCQSSRATIPCRTLAPRASGRGARPLRRSRPAGPTLRSATQPWGRPGAAAGVRGAETRTSTCQPCRQPAGMGQGLSAPLIQGPARSRHNC